MRHASQSKLRPVRSAPGGGARSRISRSPRRPGDGTSTATRRSTHDSIEHLSYDWSRVGNPDIAPKPPFKVYLPRNTEDVVRAVAETNQLGQRLRVRSKGHSSNDLVLEEGGAILLTQTMDGIISVDADNLTATVQGGAVSAMVDDHLAPMGLGLPIIGDHRDITVGGFLPSAGSARPLTGSGCSSTTSSSSSWSTGRQRQDLLRDRERRRLLLGSRRLGRHGVVTPVTLRVIEIDKYRTIWRNHQKFYTDMEAFIAGTKPIIEDPGDAMMERGVWSEFVVKERKVGFGQFSAYHETGQSLLAKGRNTAVYGVLHGIGLAAGNLPDKIDKVVKYVSIGGVMKSPAYASIKNIEFFTDKLLDSTVGDPTRMLIALGPLDVYEDLFREQWELMARYRDDHGCFTFLSVYVKSIRSEYLARDGQDRFCELMFYVGIDPEKLTEDLLDQLVEEFDDIVIKFNGYKYMHTRSSKDPGKARQDRSQPAPRATPGRDDRRKLMREIALYTLEGVKDATVTTHPFNTADGLGLSMIRFNRDPDGVAGDW